MASRLNELMAQPIVPHSRRQVARFFAGLRPGRAGHRLGSPERRPALAIDAATPPDTLGGVAVKAVTPRNTAALVARTAPDRPGRPRRPPDGPGRARGDVGQAAAEPGAFGRRQHVSELAERGGKLAMEGDRRVRPAPGWRERAPTARAGRRGRQTGRSGRGVRPGRPAR